MFLFVKWMFTTVPSTLESQVCPVKANWTETDRQWSRQQHCRMLLFMLPITRTHQTHVHCKHTLKLNACLLGSHIHAHTHTHTHTPWAVDSRALSPITAEHGSAAWWEQTIWGICQVLVDSKQSTVKNALPWLGSPLPAPLCSACGGRYNPPSPRRNPSSSFHIVPFFAPTDCCRLRAPPPNLSGCRGFACEAREGATTPRRLSPFTLPTAGDAAWRARDGRGGGRRGTRRKKMKKKVFVFACVLRESCRT